jgi:Zn-dependent oligopeptidase
MKGAHTKTWLDDLNRSYEQLHTAKEDAFWAAKMGLADDAGAAQEENDRREIELQRFMRDPERLTRARDELARTTDETARTALAGWVETFEAHVIEGTDAGALADEIVADEGQLERARGEMDLGYRAPSGEHVSASSVKLGVMLRSEPDEALRKAAWEGLGSIEPYVIEHGFLDLIRKRNRLGRALGGEDYYDWKTQRVERMSKAEVFALLDQLEERTRDSARRSLRELRAEHGDDAARPWNINWFVSGDATREQDPYFPFGAALERWGRSFAALGIEYRGAELVLDLVDRQGKYENGFMHGPVVAWRDEGRLTPARIHFTANAIPGMVGSGHRATATLFHEGGHAAHFANIDMPAPCFGQEFAPTSVGFSETQSMFLDSLIDDADWQRRYARDAAGEPMPVEVIEKALRARQPFAAWGTRSMLAVCYAEKALYEIPDDELTAERALETLREVERRMLFLDEGSPRPVLSVPHLLAGDSSAYYHGYVLAEMAVHQTRDFFVARDGYLVDNPRIGPELRDAYWRPGNSRSFDQLVRDLIGAPLAAQALAERVNRTADQAVAEARASIERLESVPAPTGPVTLAARIRVVHGRETVAELDPTGDTDAFGAFAQRFADWVTELQEKPA